MTQVKIDLPIGDPKQPTPPVELEIDGVKHKVSPTGEILDDAGKVLKTKDEVALLLNPKVKTPEEIEAERLAAEKAKLATTVTTAINEGDEIEIDGITLKIDKDGNAVDKDNKIVKTKTEVETLVASASSSDPVVDYVQEIQKNTNLVILKDEKPVVYDNTVEGLTGYVKDVHQSGIELGKQQHTDELFSKFPVVKQLITHLVLNNGDISNFNNTVDYSTIKLGEDEQQWETIYVSAKVAQGVPMQEAKDMFKYLKDDKKAKPATEASLQYLVTTQTERNNRAAQILKQQEEDAAKADADYWNNINGIIKSKTVKLKDASYVLPDVVRVKDKEGRTVVKTLDDFVNYMSAPININIDGKLYTVTQYEYDKYLEEESRNEQDEVFDAFRKFTKYDDSQLIANAIKSEKTKQVIKLSTKSTPVTITGSQKIVLPIKK